MLRVLVCGSRDWTDKNKIEGALFDYGVQDPRCKGDLVIIEGECRGADIIARNIAEKNGWTVLKYPADWDHFGLAAGPIRNQDMLDTGRPDLVLAFHDDLENSKGTKDMVTRAKKAGIPVGVIGHEPITKSAE